MKMPGMSSSDATLSDQAVLYSCAVFVLHLALVMVGMSNNPKRKQVIVRGYAKVGQSRSPFVLPVHHRVCVALQTKASRQ